MPQFPILSPSWSVPIKRAGWSIQHPTAALALRFLALSAWADAQGLLSRMQENEAMTREVMQKAGQLWAANPVRFSEDFLLEFRETLPTLQPGQMRDLHGTMSRLDPNDARMRQEFLGWYSHLVTGYPRFARQVQEDLLKLNACIRQYAQDSDLSASHAVPWPSRL